jgi:hypothetical protein
MWSIISLVINPVRRPITKGWTGGRKDKYELLSLEFNATERKWAKRHYFICETRIFVDRVDVAQSMYFRVCG